jgi:hypothetical protein
MQHNESGKHAAGHGTENVTRSGREHRGTVFPERRVFDRMLASISARCMNAPVERLDGEIETSLKDVTDFFVGDRTFLWEIAEDQRHAILTHFRMEGGSEPPVRIHLQETLPYIFNSVLGLQNLCVSQLDDLPPSAHIDRQYLDRAGIRSFLVIPFWSAAPTGSA